MEDIFSIAILLLKWGLFGTTSSPPYSRGCSIEWSWWLRRSACCWCHNLGMIRRFQPLLPSLITLKWLRIRHSSIDTVVWNEIIKLSILNFIFLCLVVVSLLLQRILINFFTVARSVANSAHLISLWFLLTTLVDQFLVRWYLRKGTRHHCTLLKSFAWCKIVLMRLLIILIWNHRHGLTCMSKMVGVTEFRVPATKSFEHIFSFHDDFLS